MRALPLLLEQLFTAFGRLVPVFTPTFIEHYHVIIHLLLDASKSIQEELSLSLATLHFIDVLRPARNLKLNDPIAIRCHLRQNSG